MESGAGAGAGGKIRRSRPTHRAAAASPYARPPAAAAAHRLAAAAAAAADAPGGGEGGGWVSRLVDPASRLIAGGAARLFSTVFRNRFAPAPALAPAPPQQPLPAPHGRDAEPKQDLIESTYTGSATTLEGWMEKGKNPASTSDDKALSEVEHLLMQKTFTRVEFDRLTDLLRTRTVESDLPAQLDYHEDKIDSSARIVGIGGSTSLGMGADHSPVADVPLRGVSSPAELAKQYMSSRYSRGPQSSLRSRVFLENKAEAINTAYDRRGSGAPAVQELNGYGNANLEFSVNGYLTPELRGRSAIHRMSRSPFFKMEALGSVKCEEREHFTNPRACHRAPTCTRGPSSSNDMNVSPFPSSHAQPRSLVASSRQALKRRVTDFDNEFGSIGPIRRIRQKANMMPPLRDSRASLQENFLPSQTIGSDFTAGSSPVQEYPHPKRLLLGSGQSLRSVELDRNGEHDKSSSDNVPPAPPQSNKMAAKIFEQLNIIAPSTKEKQSGQQSVSGNANRSISKQPVRQDNRPNSVSDPSSSRQFEDLDGVNRLLDPDLNGPPLNKDNLTKDGPSKIPPYLLQDQGNKDIKSDHIAVTDKPAILGNSVSSSTSQKPGFKMAVFEDLSEFDDDQVSPVPSKNSLSKTQVKTIQQKFDSKINETNAQPSILEQKVESNLLKEKVVSPSVSEQPIISPLKDVSSASLLSSNDDTEKKAISHVSVDNNSDFAFPHASSGDCPETTVPHASNKDDKLPSASPFTFGLNQSSSSELGISTTAGVKTNTGVEESATKPNTLEGATLERGSERERAEDVHKSSVNLPSGASTSIASAPSTSPNLLSNGFSHSLSPKLTNVTSTDKPAVSPAAPTTITTFAVSNSSPSVYSSPAFPTFNLDSSTSSTAAKSESTNIDAKQGSSPSFGTLGTTAAAKSIVSDTASKTASNLNDAPISSNFATFSSSPVASSTTFLSTATFSSPAAASSSDGTTSTNSVSSTTLSAASGVQSASAKPFVFSSSGNSAFGFSAPTQTTGLSTSVASSTSQPSATSIVFGSKPPQSVGTMSQPSQSSATLFSSPFPTETFGAGASSSGHGIVSSGVGTSSTGSGTFSSIVAASSSGPGTALFGTGASTSGPGTASFGSGVSTSGLVTASLGAGDSSSGSGIFSFGSSGPSSGPLTSSFGVTTSSGSGFANSPFRSGANFSSAGSGFAFSSSSSSAGSSSAVASTSMFSSSSMPSSSPAFSNPFGSSSPPSSMFTFGQSASSGGSFSFGVQSAPAFTSQAPVFSFTSASASLNSSSPQPVFGLTNTNTAFSMGSPGNDQMNVEDSMTDDTSQAAPTPVPAPVFGSSPFVGQAGSSAAPVFGAPLQAGGVFQFGSQQGAAQQNPAFTTGGSLEFQGGNFSLGSGGGGGDKSSRRMIKVKRGAQKKR